MNAARHLRIRRTVCPPGFLAAGGWLCWLAVVLAPLGSTAESIVNSKQNLSTSSPGAVKAVTESEICVFCHTPHNSSTEAPLWNHYNSGAAPMCLTAAPPPRPSLASQPGLPSSA
ncbi:MAG: hypothetical protein AAB466_05895 [Verrucomicrobiota bacterium]|mgnify:CR=1 FL=1